MARNMMRELSQISKRIDEIEKALAEVDQLRIEAGVELERAGAVALRNAEALTEIRRRVLARSKP